MFLWIGRTSEHGGRADGGAAEPAGRGCGRGWLSCGRFPILWFWRRAKKGSVPAVTSAFTFT